MPTLKFWKSSKSSKVQNAPVGRVKRPKALRGKTITANNLQRPRIQRPSKYNFSGEELRITNRQPKIFSSILENPAHKAQALNEYKSFVRRKGVEEYEKELEKRAKSNKTNTTQMSTMELMQQYSKPHNIVAAPALSKHNIGLALNFQATEKEKARLAREKQTENDEARAIMIAIPEFTLSPDYEVPGSLSRKHYPEEYNTASKRRENYIQQKKDLTNLNPKILAFLQKRFATTNTNEIKKKLEEIREKYGTEKYHTIQVSQSDYGEKITPAYEKVLNLLRTKEQNTSTSKEDAYSSYFNGGAHKTHKQHKSNKFRKLSKRNVKSKTRKNRK